MDSKNQKFLRAVGFFCILASLFALGVSFWKGDGLSSAGLSAAVIGLILMALSTPSFGKKD